MNEINSFRKGIRDGLPICIGYISVSFAFGIFAVSLGLSVLEATLISLLNLTSAGQLAGAPIIAARGSAIELVVTQLVINMRYALMSVSLSQKLSDKVSIPDRLLISYANTDEIFAVSTSHKERVGRRYMFGLMLTPIIGWTVGTLVGAIAGDILPSSVVSALGIAIYAMLIAIVLPAARYSLKTALCVGVTVLLSCIFYYTPVLSDIPAGFTITIIAVSVSLIFAIFAPVDDDPEQGDSGGKTSKNEARPRSNCIDTERVMLSDANDKEACDNA